MSPNARKNQSKCACALPLLLSLVASVAQADDSDAINVGLSQSLYHDSNLYRLPSGAAAPKGKRHDNISITGIDASFDRTYSRQRLRAELGVSHAAYAIHDDLDYTAPTVELGWDWRLGNHWSGVVEHRYAESMAGFEDAGGTAQLIRLFSRSALSANYWWHPDWAAGVGTARTTSRYQDNARPSSEYDTKDIDFNLTYRPATGNRMVFTLRQGEGRYPQRAAVAGSIREYSQRDARVSGDWRLTGALSTSGYIGHTRRTYDLAPSRDFSGVTGRLALTWQPTIKTSLVLSWRREIGAQQDLVSNYAVSRVVSLAPRWLISDKLALGATFEQSSRDFGGDPELGFDGLVPPQDDRTTRYNLSLQYQPIRALAFELGLQQQRRSSDFASREYKVETAWITGRFTF